MLFSIYSPLPPYVRGYRLAGTILPPERQRRGQVVLSRHSGVRGEVQWAFNYIKATSQPDPRKFRQVFGEFRKLAVQVPNNMERLALKLMTLLDPPQISTLPSHSSAPSSPVITPR